MTKPLVVAKVWFNRIAYEIAYDTLDSAMKVTFSGHQQGIAYVEWIRDESHGYPVIYDRDAIEMYWSKKGW